ncbi:hypothetical protein QFC21_002925 [Naganishia friedmannii]|uniref:Uncharacterized protein n=1 Tax=Naganishia friedmannii TaxID=89922 RepID=A0ACC2VU54_9TREE|nr:hypothetical protein QFC21_002925 [Naganishia friedmannii]
MRAATSMVNMQKRTSPTVNAMNVVRRTFGSSATVSGTKTDPPAHKMAYFPKMTSEFPRKSHEFRRVLWTGESSQLVEMTIPVKGTGPEGRGEIGNEVHHVDQHLIFTQGKCKAIIAGEEQICKAGDLCIVPQGTEHNFINVGDEELILFTVYAPAEHNPTSVHHTKEEGDKAEDEGKDEPPKWANPNHH